MGRSPRTHFPGAIFHVIGRGNGGGPIFLSDADRLHFLGILNDVKSKAGARVLAYCPMGNHYHLLIQVGQVSISSIMQRLLSRYAKHFNSVARRFGHVFQARFKAKLVKDQAYLTTLLRYIHNNPVEEGWVGDPADWAWSSHRQFVGKIRSVALDLDDALEKLGENRGQALRRYRRLMELSDDAPIVFDDAPFRSRPEARPDGRAPLESIAAEVFESTGVDVCRVPGRCRTAVVSGARRLFCARAGRLGYGVAEIARCSGLSTSAVNDHLRAAG